jgi:uncharacterized damage-inducible protein DinB
MARPKPTEYNHFYLPYIEKVEGDDFLAVQKEQLESVPDFLSRIPDEKWDYAYAPGKWTIKEVLIHICDSERVFAYRALRFGRNDHTALPGFDENKYVPYYRPEKRSPQSIIGEFRAIRLATISLFEQLDEEALLYKGIANGNFTSVRAIGFIVAGHVTHHMAVLKERYL